MNKFHFVLIGCTVEFSNFAYIQILRIMILASVLAIMGLGGQEMIFIFLALLLLFGAKKIPELARGLGKGIKEFKDATKDVRDNIEEGLKESDTK